MQRHNCTTLFCCAVAAVAMSSAVTALEAPKPEPVQKLLGPAATGANYTVKPVVRSDGIMRIFDVETSYGEFQFNGVEFTKMRLRELDAVNALEKMSQSDVFVTALGRAAVAPIQYGAELITSPVNTIQRSLAGVSNMFDRVGAGLSNNRANRDPLLESLLGVSDTQRQLAVELGVDPYTDFPPLAEKLKQMKGFPLAQTTAIEMMGRKMTTESEVIEVRKGSIPAAAWEIPAGYTKTENPLSKAFEKRR